MKKFIAILLVASLLVVLLPSTVFAAPKGIDVTGQHYNLNIIGKADFNDKTGYDNPDRHTVFVPEDTTDFSYVNPLGETVTGSIKVEISQDKSADDIYVTDGTAFDDGECGIAMPDRKYKVFICSKGKPGGSTDITAKVYYDGTTQEYLIDVGYVSVTRNWSSAYDLFWVSPAEDTIGPAFGQSLSGDTWIFDYLNYLAGLESGDQASEYYWDFDNNGNKLVKVRFYPIS